MAARNPTPPHALVDERGRPYFLWDSDMTLDELRRQLASSDPEVKAYYIGKIMRQAKPDDVFEFVDARTIRSLWSLVVPHLGTRREMWEWLFEGWERIARESRDR